MDFVYMWKIYSVLDSKIYRVYVLDQVNVYQNATSPF